VLARAPGGAEARRAVPHAAAQPGGVRLHPVGEDLDALRAGEGARGLAGDESEQPGHTLGAEVLPVRGVRVEGALDRVEVHRGPDAHTRVEPPARQDVDRREVLGQPQRVLPAQRDHRGAQLDAAGALRGRGEHRDGRGDAVLEVPVPDPRAVEPEPFAQLDHAQGGLVAGAGVRAVERADREEPQLVQRFRGRGHALIITTGRGARRHRVPAIRGRFRAGRGRGRTGPATAPAAPGAR
jgi:hypothetical protein